MEYVVSQDLIGSRVTWGLLQCRLWHLCTQAGNIHASSQLPTAKSSQYVFQWLVGAQRVRC